MQPQLARGYQMELVNTVLVDSLVLLKLERHAREQAKRGADLAQGVLLGLSSPIDNSNPSSYLRVEVTNSFPHLPALPAGAEVTADKRDEELTNQTWKYQIEMMKSMRSVRVDHLQVGWYQCVWSGSSASSETGSTAAASDKAPLLSLSMTREMLDSQLNYQTKILESVLLLFDLGAVSGMSVRVYRLSAAIFDLLGRYGYSESSIQQPSSAACEMMEAFRRARIASPLALERCFHELPVSLRISPLQQMLLLELERRASEPHSNAVSSAAFSTHAGGAKGSAAAATTGVGLCFGGGARASSAPAPGERALAVSGDTIEATLRGTMASLDLLLGESTRQQGYLRQLVKLQQSLLKRLLESGVNKTPAGVEEEMAKARSLLAQQSRQPSLLEPALLAQQLSLHTVQLETLATTALGGLLAGSSAQRPAQQEAAAAASSSSASTSATTSS
jgi:hypothetical protein